ncbi:RagB/SusD family nutrient uptake outer membrane protein [Bacteroides nordii]|uniref:RagB/SusD family nutrient uptake outer membrane protein n=1 Tax=Bacteroides nordii TaxID=291645 RepID=UPI00203C1933|nr:RagB/SusD family nutrient uptake outer membrane protein [Bacteroides nordii]GFZ38695.1 membrane protein [Bacteroides nordii]
MKKRILYSFILAASLSLVGCSSFLEEDPKDQMPESEVYKNPDLIYLNTVANLYTMIGADYGGGGLAGTDRGLYDLNTFTADEAILPTRDGDWDDGGLWRDLFQHNWGTSNDLVIGTWDYLYKVIVSCNQSIDKLVMLQKEYPDNELFGTYKSEVRALRAMYYYYLLDMFARVPVVESSTIEIKDVRQSKRSEVFAFVRKELEESLPDLSDAKSAAEGEYYGRMTQSVANYILAKLALNAEIYTDDDWTDAVKPDGKNIKFTVDGEEVNCWEATVKYCNRITASGYALTQGLNGFSANFAAKNEGSIENIFVIPMDPTLYKANMMYLTRSRHYAVGAALGFGNGGWNGSSATLEAMKAFGYGTDTPDPRLDRTYYTGKVMVNGQYVEADGKVLEYKPLSVKLKFDKSDADMKVAGARMFKYEADPAATNDGKLQHNDYVLFRYSDVLLMKAEALFRDGKGGQSELNQVRDRVGAPQVVISLENILKERLLELAWEGVRRQDLIRFGEFTKAITDRPKSQAYKTVFPIHEKTLSVNKNLSQNPGYGK